MIMVAARLNARISLAPTHAYVKMASDWPRMDDPVWVSVRQ